MKIVHVCNLPFAEDHPDYGRLFRHPGRWPLNIAMAQGIFGGLDVKCVVATSGASKPYITDFDGVEIHYIPVPSRFRSATLFYRETRAVAAYVKSLQPDLVHAHGSEDSNLLIARKTGLPFVFTAQALFFQMKKRVRFPLICRQRVTGFLEDRALQKTRFSIGKSEYVKEGLERRYPAMQVELIPNTFDERLLDMGWAKTKKPAVAYVGTVDHRKGVDLIVEALSRLRDRFPDVELWMFGNTRNARGYEQGVLDDLHSVLGEKLKLFGYLPPAELISRLSECKALLAPSREEMFGNQVIESLLAGTHVIVADQTAMAENVRRFGNGTIIHQEDSSALAEAIAGVLGQSEFHEQKEARQNILSYMGAESVAKAHADYYQRVLREWIA